MANPTTALAPTQMTAIVGGTAAARYIGANPTRNGLSITNQHASQTCSITNRGNTAPVSLAGGTVLIPAASTVSFPSAAFPFAWTDEVNGICSGATTPITITEF